MTTGLTLDVEGRIAVLQLSGELDITIRFPLRDLVYRALGADVDGFVVDLSELAFTDMAGINGLILLAGQAAPRGMRVVLAASPRFLDRILNVLELYTLFHHAPTRAVALRLAQLPIAARGSAQ